MKKIIWIPTLIVSALAILAAPLSQVCIAFGCPSQYDETYYGELKEMYAKVKETKEKKIVIIGNSNVAFGVNSAYMEELLRKEGLDYKVCNFGLYGSIGTKVMLDLSKPYINKDDIVIFIPELYQQPFSLYFSGKEMLYALDSDFSMFSDLTTDNKKEVIGNLSSYNAEKMSCIFSGKKATSGEIYSKASFDSNCDMTKASRDFNVMYDNYDINNLVSFSTDFLTSDYVDYVNAYAKEIQSRGASIYYSYTPVNKKALQSDKWEIQRFNDAIHYAFQFKILSSPENYIYEPNWFFDSNFHLNSYGMELRTLNLVSDLYNQFGITTDISSLYPEEPELIEIEEEDDTNADDSYVDCFTYLTDGENFTISGLTEKGKEAKTLVIPYHFRKGRITSFDYSVFQNDTNLEQVTIQRNIKLLKDYSFQGCTNLKEIRLQQTNPEKLSVGYSLLFGTDAKIYIPKSAYQAYSNNYFWGHYAGEYETY